MDIASIQQRIKMIEDLEAENRTLKDMIKSALDSDPSFKEISEEAKAKALEKKRVRDHIMLQDGNQKTVSDVKANLEEISTLKEILSAELVDFYGKNKTDEIDDGSGKTRKFKFAVKLEPKKEF